MKLLGWGPSCVAGIQGYFLDEVPRFPPKRDVDPMTELVPSKTPVSKTPCKLSTPEMIELKM